MIEFNTSIDIDAAPDTVWSLMRDVEGWTEWTPTVIAVEPLSPGPLAVGSRYRLTQPKFPAAVWEISELEDANRTFTWVSTGPAARVTASHRVEALESGSRAHLSIRYTGIVAELVARLTAGTNKRYIDLEATSLREESERLDSLQTGHGTATSVS